ncbi:hypothetical protein AVEN_202560-1 [Araneus ventricosus]|uniref:Uncharacterized protein n=1 Tax=Araneus ventricosus TaxID=182803 RepID=A0A4Y2JU88_ARAVE|nr:hypothetical protein AVEN_202560-1 [Araneus ventricosus]
MLRVDSGHSTAHWHDIPCSLGRLAFNNFSGLNFGSSNLSKLHGDNEIMSSSLTGPVVTALASEPVGREFYPGLCSHSVFAIICKASLLQVPPMVTSRLALTCCKLVSHLHTCRDKFAESLQTCSASLLQTKIAIWDTVIAPKTATVTSKSDFCD